MTQRPRGRCSGTPITIAGATWLLASPPPGTPFDPVRDRIVDDNLLLGRYRVRDVQFAAMILLQLNYELEAEEAAQLVVTADPDDLRRGVETAAFHRVDKTNRSYSAWVASALLANGIRPADVTAGLIGPVLAHLEHSGRIVAWEAFSQAIEARDKMGAIRSRAAEQEIADARLDQVED